MKTLNFLCVIAGLIVLTGCSLSNEKDKSLPFETIAKGTYGYASEQDKKISSQEKWEEFLMTWSKSEIDRFSETEIDFDKYQIIVVIVGCPDTSWSTNIIRITEYSERIIVTVQVKTHGGYAMDTLTLPYHIVKIPVTTKNIDFKHIN